MAKAKFKYSGMYPDRHYSNDMMLKHINLHDDNIRIKLKTHGKKVKDKLKLIISTAVGNGRHYNGMPNRSSSSGNPPVSQSGRLESGFSYKSRPLELLIGNSARNKGAPYPAFLEEGTDHMNARPYFLNTIESMNTLLEQDLQTLS